MSHPVIENRSITNGNFSNNPFEIDTGIVSATIDFNFISGGHNSFRIDIRVSDDAGAIVRSVVLNNQSAGSTGGRITINFLDSFQMGGDIPDFITIQAVLTQTNFNPERLIANVVSDNILFTGFGAQNKLISVTAENGQSLNNFVVSQSDFEQLVNVLPTFNATITGSDTLTDPNTTAVVIIEFASQNQITQPPDPDNFQVTARAENSATITGIVSSVDFTFLSSASGVTTVKGTIEGFSSSISQVTHTAQDIMDFLILNQEVEPPMPDPFAIVDFLVSFSNDQPIKFYTLSNQELSSLKTSLAQCASITDETPNPSGVSMGLAFVQNDILMICQTEPPLPCPIGQHLENGVCVPDIPTEKNICFCVSFKDSSQLCFVLSKRDFEFFVANPVKLAGVGDQYVIVNETECDDIVNNLSDVFQQVFDKIKEVNEDFISPNMVLIQPNPFVINDNNTFTGSVKFIATESFNSFFYGKNIVTVLQIKDKAGVVLNQNDFKVNNLNFTEIERDEIILYTDFGAFDKAELTLEFFVFDNAQDMNSFAIPVIVNVTKDGSTMPPTNGNGGGIKFGSGGILTKVVGGFFGLLTLCLLTEKGRNN